MIEPEGVNRIFRTARGAETLVRIFVSGRVTLDVNTRFSHGETLLWKVCSAVYQGKERAALVAQLIERGAEVNVAATDIGTTPLMWASALGDPDVMALLLAAGADPLLRDGEGRTALDFARMRGSLAAELLLLAPGDPQSAEAISRGKLPVRLECPADLRRAHRWVEENADRIDDIPDLEATYRTCCRRFTPLDMALITGRRDLAARLIAKGARTVHWSILRQRRQEIFEICYRDGLRTPGFDTLALTIKRGDKEGLVWLLDHGGDPNSRREIPSSLLGEDFMAPPDTLLEVAADSGNLDFVELLLERGAVVEPVTLAKAMVASTGRDLTALRLMTAPTAPDLRRRFARGETFLWLVCSGFYRGEDRLRLAALLIHRGVDVNAADTETGTTPLMFAAARGDVNLLSRLLEAGADPLARDSEGRSSLDFARMRGRTEAAELLLLAAGNNGQD